MKMNFSLTLPLKAQYLDRRNQASDANYVGAGFLDVTKYEPGTEAAAQEVQGGREEASTVKEAVPEAPQTLTQEPTPAHEQSPAQPGSPQPPEPRPQAQAQPQLPASAPVHPKPPKPVEIPEKIFDSDSAKVIRKFQETCLKVKERFGSKEVIQIDLPEELTRDYPQVVNQILKAQDKFYQIQTDMLAVMEGSDAVLREAVSLALLCGGYRLDKTPSFLKSVRNEVRKTENAFESKIRMINKAFNIELDEQKKALTRQAQATEEVTLKAQALEEELLKARKEAEKTRDVYANSKVTIDTKMKNFEELNRFIIDVLEDKKRLNAALELKSNQLLELKKEVAEFKVRAEAAAASQIEQSIVKGVW